MKGFAVSYLGLSYATRPSPEELRRIVTIMKAKNNNNKSSPKGSSQAARVLADVKRVKITQESDNSVVCEFDMDKIVLCCVDATNQKMFAIFYHNDDYMADFTRGLECHLMSGKSKEVTKKMATAMGDLVVESFRLRKDREKQKKIDTGKELSYANYVKQSCVADESEDKTEDKLNEPAELLENVPVVRQVSKKVSPPKPPRASKRMKEGRSASDQLLQSADKRTITTEKAVTPQEIPVRREITTLEQSTFEFTLDKAHLASLASLSETNL